MQLYGKKIFLDGSQYGMHPLRETRVHWGLCTGD